MSMNRETSLSLLERYLLERVRALTTELNTLKLELQRDPYRKAQREDEVDARRRR